MSGQFLYNVEFSIDDYDLWSYPSELTGDPEVLSTVIRFQMKPEISLEISEEEFLDQVNCDEKTIKNAMFSMSTNQLTTSLEAVITIFKSCNSKSIPIGKYKLSKLHQNFKQLQDEFTKQAGTGRIDVDANQPRTQMIKELVQLINDEDEPTGSLHYTLRTTCFGQSIYDFSKKSRLNQQESKCTALNASSCPSSTKVKEDYNEYAAEVNGNQLIVRIHKKETDYLVTRVFDEDMDRNGNAIKRDKNVVSIFGCDQQVDLKFPENFSCGEPKKKPSSFGCGPDSLTEFQRQTSCIGKSFKNSCCLPVIRGNLKYPGRLANESLKMDFYDRRNPCDATEKYLKKPQTTRNACLQVDADNLKRELNGQCKVPKGIQICKKGCATDPDTDVFIFKIGRNYIDKKGKQSAIELEMRTPKAPDMERKKHETRECQVDETEFDEMKKTTTKKEDEKAKKAEEKPTKADEKSKKVVPTAKKSEMKEPSKTGFVKKRSTIKS